MSEDNKKNEKREDENKNSKAKIISIAVVILVLILSGIFFYFNNGKNDELGEKDEKEMPYTELITSINSGNIEKIKMTTGSGSIDVILKGEGEEKDREKTVLVPSIQAFMEWIQEKIDKEGVEIELVQENVNPLLRVAETLFSLLPTILLVVLMFMIIQMQDLEEIVPRYMVELMVKIQM